MDLKDKVNSLEFCLDSEPLSNYSIIDKESVLNWLEMVSDRLVKKTSNFKTLLDITRKRKIQNEKELEISVNNKITNCMSLALKIELLSVKVFEIKEIKVSQYVTDFVKDV